MWTSNNSYSPQERSFVADPAWFRLIPQSCITQKIFENTYHNAIWDFYVTPQGRIFLSLCAEINYPEIVRLYEYIPRTNEFRLHFKLEDRVLQHPQAIRASKMHTSFCQMKDGRLIMTTHTTAKSVLHPDWMPEAYYTHPWEGYQGSNILLYIAAFHRAQNCFDPALHFCNPTIDRRAKKNFPVSRRHRKDTANVFVEKGRNV